MRPVFSCLGDDTVDWFVSVL